MKKQQAIIVLIIAIQLSLMPTFVQYREFQWIQAHLGKPNTTDINVGSYTVPGVLSPPSNLVKVGIIGDMEDYSGIHAWKGALLAAKEINQAGGISIGGNTYHIGLVSEDTDEANPILDISRAVTAANTMVTQHDPDFVIGGYRTEALQAYVEVFMDNQIPFLSVGSAADDFCVNVLNFYARYKYFFRTMPLNNTGIARELITYLITIATVLNATYSGTMNKFAILREDLEWTQPFSDALNVYLPLFGYSVVTDIAFPVTLTPTDMASLWNQINNTDAQITIPLISSQVGILMMSQYEVIQPGCLVVGIDVHSQLDSFWDNTGGGCQYEVISQPLYKVNKTSLTIPFWNSFLYTYDEEPLYTGVGSYDSIRILTEAINNAQNLNPDVIVGELEGFNYANPFQGVSGQISFTGSHDLLEGWPFGTSLFCQWNSFGSKEVLPSWGMIYPNSIATGSLKIPYWGINLLTGPQPLPGALGLSSDADIPDNDGKFNLTWSSSVGASSYSVYYSTEPSLSRLVKITDGATSPFTVSNLMTGDYYFVIAAHNDRGETLSNSHYVDVERPNPGPFTLTSDADTPDSDGEFNLIWSNSEGVDNYSVYGYTEYITEINKSHILLADQMFGNFKAVDGLSEGQYYFIVEAHNESGQTLSNCLSILVDHPAPGPFTLSSDAGSPDQDGGFNLMWTVSAGADNYSLFRHSAYITEINSSITTLADQNALSPFSVSGLTTGSYYFVAISYNETGNTYSNNLHISVQIPSNGEIPGFNIIFSLLIISVLSTIIIIKFRKKLKTVF